MSWDSSDSSDATDDDNMDWDEKLYDACMNGDLSLVQTAVSHGADINCYRGAPLMWSVFNNHPSITRYLLGWDNINVNSSDKYDKTVLHFIQDETPGVS